MSEQKLIQFLNRELANFHVMYVKLHRYHWFVQGRHFFTLHKLFETLYNEMAEDIDELAERILAIGGKPLATMQKFLAETTLKEAEADDKETEIMFSLQKDYMQMVKEIKTLGLPLCEEAKDEGTADLLTGLLKRFEKHGWMFNAYLAYN